MRIQAIRGMNDILPEHTPCWQHLECAVRATLSGYGYQEIRLPVVEKTELFARAIGEVTDIVEKEMYTFTDRNGDSLTLRPEGTAGCVRAALEHGMLREARKLWYSGPMFRHEKPQKGRYRQFHQVGVECYGMDGPDIDAELMLMTARLWQSLGLNGFQLELNSLGSAECRLAYRERLVEYLSDHRQQLDEDSQRRLGSNPLRVLDTKNPDMQTLVSNAPALLDHLDAASAEHFAGVRERLDSAGVAYRINTRLVRGLDYYSRTVFEWTTDQLGAQGTVCAGGRYDGLVEQLGGKPVAAVGFAMGLERLVAMLCDEQPLPAAAPHAYLVLIGESAGAAGQAFAEQLREQLPVLRLRVNMGGGSFKAQFKRADKSGAALALVIGEDELAKQQVTVKFLREDRQQETLDADGIRALMATEIDKLRG